MNQNDIVEVTGLFGTVEKITIRSVALRTLDGGYHLIPFSAIDCISNHTWLRLPLWRVLRRLSRERR